MIRNTFIAIMAFLYFAVSSGVAMNIHYCMGKVAYITFGHQNEDHKKGNCGKCGMDQKENHCCTEETQFIKITDFHKNSTALNATLSDSLTLPVTVISLTETAQGFSIEPFIEYFSPPLPTYNKVYKAVNVFRI